MTAHPDLLHVTPQELARVLRAAGIRRFWFVTDPATGRVTSSHRLLDSIATFLERERRDFMGHEGLFFQITRRHGVLQGAFIHRTNRGQAAGGVRHWEYPRFEDFLRDGLRLAVGMTRKNALAGLWWGGGKGVMARNPDIDLRDREARASIYREYGELISSLRGVYVTAEDVGTNVADMAEVFTRTRFVTCIPPALGGSGNPSAPTARGVVCGMEAALVACGAGDLRGKTVAVQGLGNVGSALVGFLLERGVKRVIAADVSAEAVQRLTAAHPGADIEAQAVPPGDTTIVEADCDVFAPCATGAILNARTIPRLRTRIVCGAANNQLEDPAQDDRRLVERGITYVPDFLVNRMGIVTCADEQAGYVTPDPLIERHLSRDWESSIHKTTLAVLATARESGVAPGQVAIAMADRLADLPHPLYGHRGRAIIDSLVKAGWHEEG